MIFDFTLKTGNSTLSGSMSSNYDNNYSANFSYDGFLIPILDRTGTHDIIASLNSQTIVEVTPSYTSTQFQNIYSGNGDYYFVTGDSLSKIYFLGDLDINNLQEKNLFFDLRPTLQAAIGTGITSGGMQNSLMQDIKIKMTGYTGDLNQLNFFLNGQKIYSGDSYSIINNTGFQYKQTITGKIFAIPKKEKSHQLTGLNYDLYGYKFIENDSNLYINGMEEQKNNWIEINTGVKNIVTGLSAKIIEKFNVSTQIFL